MPLKVLSPYTGDVIDEVHTTPERVMNEEIDKAYYLYRNKGALLPLIERIGILERVVKNMGGERMKLALQASNEGGKPLRDSLIEVDRAIEGVKLCIEKARGDAGAVIPIQGAAAGANMIAFTQKEPIGVVVAISAFNHPLNLIVHQVATAVAAGCPVLVKPSSETPLSCRSFIDVLYKSGLPTEWCRFIMPEDDSLAESMVTDKRIAFLTFIGSAKVGWMLRSKLAPGTRCALEHGGAAPVIVADDADITLAVNAIARGGFYHAGQVCVSVQRVFVEKRIARVFAERLANAASAMVIGDPIDPKTEVGPLIRSSETNRIDQWVKNASSDPLAGGKILDHNCYECTVLFNPPDMAEVSTREIFGPVVCVYEYDNLEVAITRANSVPFSFQAALFTRDIDRAIYIYRHIDASAVMANTHTAFRVDGMPFAGLRQSGLGTGGIPYTIDDMQVDKMFALNPGVL